MSALYMIVGTLVALGVLVTFHEFGHFWVARRCGCHPGAEVHPVRIRRPLADHFQVLQALAQEAHAPVDLAQHLLAVDVFGVFRAIAEGGGFADRLGHLGTAHVPEFMQLCA